MILESLLLGERLTTNVTSILKSKLSLFLRQLPRFPRLQVLLPHVLIEVFFSDKRRLTVITMKSLVLAGAGAIFVSGAFK